MPWLAVNDKSIPSFIKGQKIEVSKVELYEVRVESPNSNSVCVYSVLDFSRLLVSNIMLCFVNFFFWGGAVVGWWGVGTWWCYGKAIKGICSWVIVWIQI